MLHLGRALEAGADEPAPLLKVRRRSRFSALEDIAHQRHPHAEGATEKDSEQPELEESPRIVTRCISR